MTNLNPISATPTVTFLRSRFAPWQMLCGESTEAFEEEGASVQAEQNDVDDFDAEDPRDISVRDRLARLEAFSAA